MDTAARFKAENRIEDILAKAGVKLDGGGNEKTAHCPFHEDGRASFGVNVEKQLWNCLAGCGGGDAINLVAMLRGITPAQLLSELAAGKNQSAEQWRPVAQPKPQVNGGDVPQTLVCTYEYQNFFGDVVYRVLRYNPKNFRQQKKTGNGTWEWNMDNVSRVLYHLPEVLASDTVWISEGEKDVDNLRELGFVATTNVGGAGKWLDSYSDDLVGKDLIVCGDNGDAGLKHVQQVFESVAGKAKTVKIVNLPSHIKDVSDFINTFPESHDAKAALERMAMEAVPFTKGFRMPLYTMPELEVRYIHHTQHLSGCSLDLGLWIPSLGLSIRRLVPGELAVILADTGVGKTALLSSIAIHAGTLPTVLFELELPAELLYERLVAMKHGIRCDEIERVYQNEAQGQLASDFPNLYICTESGLAIDTIEEMINHSELRIGERPKLVLVDYIGLVGAKGSSRYDRVSNVAEKLKVVAKSTHTIVVCASQVHRPEDGDVEVSLHDAKDSGSIENSSGLVLGCWRDPNDAATLWIKILKNTKGKAGKLVECNFDGPTMRITEKSKISDDDVPYLPHAD